MQTDVLIDCFTCIAWALMGGIFEIGVYRECSRGREIRTVVARVWNLHGMVCLRASDNNEEGWYIDASSIAVYMYFNVARARDSMMFICCC